MRMPPLPADSIHARACKLKCEKILTRPRHGGRLCSSIASGKRMTPAGQSRRSHDFFCLWLVLGQICGRSSLKRINPYKIYDTEA